jgi:eukaryotic-like serine/threonine-protein kinase
MIDCPSEETLRRLFGEQLTELELRQIETHSEHCDQCQQRLHILSQGIAAPVGTPIRSASRPCRASSSCEEREFLSRLSQQVLIKFYNSGAGGNNSADLNALPEIEGYDVLEELGRGAAGIVYRAHHHKLNRDVALKMISVSSQISTHARQRFELEAQALARLRHPNIVQVYDACQWAGRPYLTLELIEGENLDARLGGVPMPARDAARIVQTLARAVEYAHSQGIIHRDLKLANILLGKTNGLSFKNSGHDGKNAVPLTECEVKIADFGLAKILSSAGASECLMTHAGTILGTPAFIAPEQAQGNPEGVGPSADIYALGAILYALLCGRPPFQDATSLETLLQVVHHEPVPIRRLMPQVARDLETICAKCLQKHPASRYSTAGNLADDLERFLTGEPIRARPIGIVERALRWMRRRPAQAAAIAATVMLVFVVTSGAIWLGWQEMTKSRQIKDDLHEADLLQQHYDWPEANARLERAKLGLGNGGPTELRQEFVHLEQVRRNKELSARLEEIRLDRAAVLAGPFAIAQPDARYEAEFDKAGLGRVGDDIECVGSRIAASPIREALLAALDDWSICTDRRRQEWLMAVARFADTDPWRNQVRDPAIWGERSKLAALAESEHVAGQPVQSLIALAARLTAVHGDAIKFLKHVQQEYPSDFWVNFTLGSALARHHCPEAAGYFRAALAIRPKTTAVYNGLGVALRFEGKTDEAIREWHRAIELDPNSPYPHCSLGGIFKAQGRLTEAIEEYCQAVRIDTNYGWAHYVLGNALRQAGQLDNAIEHYERAIALEPDLIQAHADLGVALKRKGRISDAVAQYRQIVQLRPDSSKAYYNLGAALWEQGLLPEAIEHLQHAIMIDPKLAQAYETLAHLYVSLGRFDEAHAITQKGQEVLPSSEFQQDHQPRN